MNLLETHHSIRCLSDKESYHSYISKFYNDILTPLKKQYISILEIGIQYGHSIKLWDTFFDHAKIYGLDVINNLQHDFSDKVITIGGNAYSADSISFFQKQNLLFDIIIDDGPHSLESQIFFIDNYIKLLNNNGLLIVEDVYFENLPILQTKYPNFITLDLTEFEPEIPKKENNSIIFYYRKSI